MKTTNFLSLTAILFTFLACSNTSVNYQYKDKPETITCEIENKQLFKEAYYSFENDLLNFYDKQNRSNLTRSMSQFIRLGVVGKASYKNMVSSHSAKVLNALKADASLWSKDNDGKTCLNYNSPIFKCITENMANDDLKTTLNALASTNSMSRKLFGAPLGSNYQATISDKHLATYAALDLYFANLVDIDLSTIDFSKKETPKTPQPITKPATATPTKDPHAGHNHN